MLLPAECCLAVPDYLGLLCGQRWQEPGHLEHLSTSSQAIIAEVYTLNALLFFAVYLLILKALRAPDSRTWWWGASIFFGLSLANHYPLMVLAFPGLLVLALPVWRSVLSRLTELILLSLLNAALPYAAMVWRSLQNPAINFYGPIEGWQDF